MTTRVLPDSIIPNLEFGFAKEKIIVSGLRLARVSSNHNNKI